MPLPMRRSGVPRNVSARPRPWSMQQIDVESGEVMEETLGGPKDLMTRLRALSMPNIPERYERKPEDDAPGRDVYGVGRMSDSQKRRWRKLQDANKRVSLTAVRARGRPAPSRSVDGGMGFGVGKNIFSPGAGGAGRVEALNLEGIGGLNPASVDIAMVASALDGEEVGQAPTIQDLMGNGSQLKLPSQLGAHPAALGAHIAGLGLVVSGRKDSMSSFDEDEGVEKWNARVNSFDSADGSASTAKSVRPLVTRGERTISDASMGSDEDDDPFFRIRGDSIDAEGDNDGSLAPSALSDFALMSRVKMSKGSRVWVQGSRSAVWELGTVLAAPTTTKVFVVKDTGERMNALRANTFLCNPSVEIDIASLWHIHGPGILHNIQQRSLADEPYTFAGPVLIVVNPLREVKATQGVKLPKAGKKSQMEDGAMVPHIPHPYTVAELAYQQMVLSLSKVAVSHISSSNTKGSSTTPTCQSIVINGESGAGKTEAAKRVMKYLVRRSGVSDMDQLLAKGNSIFEAFGNATTLRNENSSRFGRFLKLYYDPTGHKITSGGFNVYLLEASRVTSHNPGEKNFHMLYYLVNGCSALPKTQRTRLGLKTDVNAYKYLVPKESVSSSPTKTSMKSTNPLWDKNNGDNGSNKQRVRRMTTPGKPGEAPPVGTERRVHSDYARVSSAQDILESDSDDDDDGGETDGEEMSKNRTRRSSKKALSSKHDAKQFRNIARAMDVLGVSTSEQRALCDMLAAILHLGNISFDQVDNPKSGQAQAVLSGSEGRANNERVAALLAVDADALKRTFTERQLRVGGEHMVAVVGRKLAVRARDAVAKLMYSRLFFWLVRVINRCLSSEGIKIATAKRSNRNEKSSRSKKSTAETVTVGGKVITTVGGGKGKISSKISKKPIPFIGILDIFGWEAYQVNGFEQLLIALAQEQLQEVFTLKVFEAELGLYEREGLVVDTSNLKPPTSVSRRECIRLLRGGKLKKHPGILQIIDAQGQLPTHSETRLNDAIHREFVGQPCFAQVHPKDRASCFRVVHYAGAITYKTGSFLDKNDSKVPKEIESLFTGKYCAPGAFVRQVWAVEQDMEDESAAEALALAKAKEAEEKEAEAKAAAKAERRKARRGSRTRTESDLSSDGGRDRGESTDSFLGLIDENILKEKGKEEAENKSSSKRGSKADSNSERRSTKAIDFSRVSVSGKFLLQMKELIKTLGGTSCTFIRCIKPNPHMKREPLSKLTNVPKSANSSANTPVSSSEWFDRQYIAMQMVHLNLVETANTLKAGFPSRVPHRNIVKKYSNVFPEWAMRTWRKLGKAKYRSFVAALFFAFEIPSSDYKLGYSRVFFQSGLLNMLDNLAKVIRSGMKNKHPDPKGIAERRIVVSRFKLYHARARWRSVFTKVICVNRFKRLLKVLRRRVAAVIVLQTWARSCVDRKLFKQTTFAARQAQKFVRGMQARIKVQRKREAILQRIREHRRELEECARMAQEDEDVGSNVEKIDEGDEVEEEEVETNSKASTTSSTLSLARPSSWTSFGRSKKKKAADLWVESEITRSSSLTALESGRALTTRKISAVSSPTSLALSKKKNIRKKKSGVAKSSAGVEVESDDDYKRLTIKSDTSLSSVTDVNHTREVSELVGVLTRALVHESLVPESMSRRPSDLAKMSISSASSLKFVPGRTNTTTNSRSNSRTNPGSSPGSNTSINSANSRNTSNSTPSNNSNYRRGVRASSVHSFVGGSVITDEQAQVELAALDVVYRHVEEGKRRSMSKSMDSLRAVERVLLKQKRFVAVQEAASIARDERRERSVTRIKHLKQRHKKSRTGVLDALRGEGRMTGLLRNNTNSDDEYDDVDVVDDLGAASSEKRSKSNKSKTTSRRSSSKSNKSRKSSGRSSHHSRTHRREKSKHNSRSRSRSEEGTSRPPSGLDDAGDSNDDEVSKSRAALRHPHTKTYVLQASDVTVARTPVTTWAHKLSLKSKRNWKRRYFVVNADKREVIYYKESSDGLRMPRGRFVIDPPNATPQPELIVYSGTHRGRRNVLELRGGTIRRDFRGVSVNTSRDSKRQIKRVLTVGKHKKEQKAADRALAIVNNRDSDEIMLAAPPAPVVASGKDRRGLVLSFQSEPERQAWVTELQVSMTGWKVVMVDENESLDSASVVSNKSGKIKKKKTKKSLGKVESSSKGKGKRRDKRKQSSSSRISRDSFGSSTDSDGDEYPVTDSDEYETDIDNAAESSAISEETDSLNKSPGSWATGRIATAMATEVGDDGKKSRGWTGMLSGISVRMGLRSQKPSEIENNKDKKNKKKKEKEKGKEEKKNKKKNSKTRIAGENGRGRSHERRRAESAKSNPGSGGSSRRWSVGNRRGSKERKGSKKRKSSRRKKTKGAKDVFLDQLVSTMELNNKQDAGEVVEQYLQLEELVERHEIDEETFDDLVTTVILPAAMGGGDSSTGIGGGGKGDSDSSDGGGVGLDYASSDEGGGTDDENVQVVCPNKLCEAVNNTVHGILCYNCASPLFTSDTMVI